MLGHFLNVSFTRPQALELDKGQEYWWLHVVFPYFILFTAQQEGGNQEKKGKSPTMLIHVSSFSEPGYKDLIGGLEGDGGGRLSQ